ncbi:MAG TPA: amidohydrolase family protein [Phenylobacterium sp.]|uniref:amidohydrolase family protein n=1 Tax=Phenylobacterium sp. TaxID=1871053 RepID=UPI002B46FFAF|nr:amidohydrolase family protein [Phenylobacterium sp.]HKR89902.1 amidohydrolase family protein [Phenylobacterium sp.]HKT54658.1 amidohydrolase family protein [Caulobacteraceae bacterium]
MIIDIHAHLWAPPVLNQNGLNLLGSDGSYAGMEPKIADDLYREHLSVQLKAMDQVGTDLQMVSPRPFTMMHSRGARVVDVWTSWTNNAIAQQVRLAPGRFMGMAGLPQVPGQPVERVFPEMERCLNELGFKSIIINPDPAEGMGNIPPMGDPYWYPLYEKMCEHDVPALIHAASCCNGRETYSNHFITEHSIALLSMIKAGVMQRFPKLKIIIAHGGGSVPYQIGRWRAERGSFPDLGSSGIHGRQSTAVGSFDDALRQFHFDTCLHAPPSLELLVKVAGPDAVCFGTERIGSGTQINPDTGRSYDDLKPEIEAMTFLSDADRYKIFEGNARRLFNGIVG